MIVLDKRPTCEYGTNACVLADDVEVLDIDENSAVVSWTVEYVLEQQQYYLVYGSDENMLNETSYFILGNSNTSLRDLTYNIRLDGLATGDTYYVVVVASYGFTTLFSETISFTTREPGKLMLKLKNVE